MITPVQILLLFVAIGVSVWGFERYRTRFAKIDLIVTFFLLTGLGAFILMPGIYDQVGNILNIRQRSILAFLLANLVLLLLILYLMSTIHNTRYKISELTRNLSVAQASVSSEEQKKISIVIPAYNEAATIQSVLDSLPDSLCGYTVIPIVVSDGSTDKTAQKARRNNTIVVEHLLNQGQGGALKTGFEIARQNGADIVITMDGDGQHPAKELEQLVSPIIKDKADFVMGSRYKGENLSGNSISRETGIRFFTSIINILTKSEITDCTNGFRAIRASEIEKMTLTEERFSAPELIIEACKNELRIEEIPITIEQRQAGESKKPQLGYAIGLIQAILTTWVR